MFKTNSPGYGAVAILLMSAGLTGCVSSHIIVGTVRPPIPAEQVQIYLHPPEGYEEVAVLQTSSQNSVQFTSQGRIDIVIERLREEAAKLGANGILLESVGDQSAGALFTWARRSGPRVRQNRQCDGDLH